MLIRSWRTWLFLSYLSLIIYVSNQPGDNLSWLSQLWKYDKYVHFIEYLGVGFLLINAMKIKPILRKEWLLALSFLLIFPIVDESLQFFIPKRIPDIMDGVADIFGGLTGAFIRKKI